MSTNQRTLHPYCTLPEASVIARARAVRAALFDVDGVLTDGTVYAGATPQLAFHIHDGKGLRLLLEAGIEVVWITARRCQAVHTRAAELGVEHLISGRSDKGQALIEICSELDLSPTACAYTGDDLIDLPAIHRAGLGVAVADAHPSVTAAADWITTRPGGRGAAREVAELILFAQDRLAPLLGGVEG